MVEGDFTYAVGGWEEPLLEGRYHAFGFMLVAGSNVDGAVAAGEEVGGFYSDAGGAAVWRRDILATGICRYLGQKRCS